VKQAKQMGFRAARGFRKLGMGVALAMALGVAAHAQPGPPGPPPGFGGPGGPGMGMGIELNPRMFKQLNLTPDQERKLKEDRLASQKKKIQLFGEKATLELDLKNVLDTYPVKKADALKIADKIADVDKRITLQRVETLSTLLGYLTPEQHAKLMDLQEEWKEKRKAWKEEMQKEHPEFKGGKRWKDKDGKGDDE
jgi:Spy/CpxP family protein refolding chaperone